MGINSLTYLELLPNDQHSHQNGSWYALRLCMHLNLPRAADNDQKIPRLWLS